MLIIFALVVLALSAIFPLYFMAQAALRTQAEWNSSELAFPTSLSLSTFRQVWLGGEVGVFLRNSFVITVGSTALSLVISTMAGFSFAKTQWRLRKVTYYFILSWLALPPVVLIVPIYIEMVQLQGRYTINYPVIMAGLLVASIPVVVAYLFFQKFLVREW